MKGAKYRVICQDEGKYVMASSRVFSFAGAVKYAATVALNRMPMVVKEVCGAGCAVHPLRMARATRDLTQVELGKASGVASRTISLIERGSRAPRNPTRRKLLRALNIPFTEHESIFG